MLSRYKAEEATPTEVVQHTVPYETLCKHRHSYCTILTCRSNPLLGKAHARQGACKQLFTCAQCPQWQRGVVWNQLSKEKIPVASKLKGLPTKELPTSAPAAHLSMKIAPRRGSS